MVKYLSKTITILKAPMVLTIFNEIYIRFHKPQMRIFDLEQGKTAKTQATSERKKTKCQLCNRLAGPIIPFSWSNVVWKRISHWMWTFWGSQKRFSCVLGHFRHGDNRTTNRLILMQTCSWPVWEGNLWNLSTGKFSFTHDNAWSANSGDNGRNQSAKLYWGQGGRSAVWMPPNWKCKSP